MAVAEHEAVTDSVTVTARVVTKASSATVMFAVSWVALLKVVGDAASAALKGDGMEGESR